MSLSKVDPQVASAASVSSARDGRPPSIPATPSTAGSDLTTGSLDDDQRVASQASVALSVLAMLLTSMQSAYISHMIPRRHLTPLFGSIPSFLHHNHSIIIVNLLAVISACLLPHMKPPTRLRRLSLLPTDPASWLKVTSSGLALVSLAVRTLSRIAGNLLGPEWAPVAIMVNLGFVPAFAAARLTTDVVNSWDSRRNSESTRPSRPRNVAGALACSILAGLMHIIVGAMQPTNHGGTEYTMITFIIAPVLLASVISLQDGKERPATTAAASPLNLLTWTLLILSLQNLLRNPYSPSKLPLLTRDEKFKVLSIEQGTTGLIMVGESVQDGFRFLRCDHSLLGGRWTKSRELGAREVKENELGDSIFSTFVLQEAVRLAYRENPQDPREVESALIIGLGVGISAHGLMRHGVDVHIVEIDQEVYSAARTHFGLPEPSSHVFEDGNAHVIRHAAARRAGHRPTPKLDYVIHDCFSGGFVPPELFTVEFWADLGTMVKSDGIIAVNFAGVLTGKASQAVLHTLYASFAQCRAFKDNLGVAHDSDGAELSNLVIFCSMAHSPILSFRNIAEADKLRSPLRHHVLHSFIKGEVLLDKYFAKPLDAAEPGPEDSALILRRGAASHLNDWQTSSALATWHAMRHILPFSLWAIY